ncbi:unnamed protein product [Rotaria sordida]|uniref:Uncharacterized protein n=1 Tax=Rotaria sordida TaxID=392033 RepID=A0A814MFF1_9BILA|nr:unnamed protein product [Rotaria sordida]CAF1266681.1 unnamed protein product [Rotaria sordida]
MDILLLLLIKTTAFGQLTGDYGSYSPSFEKQLIEANRDDGYCIIAFQIDDQTPIGLIAFGLTVGEIKFYQNPSITTVPENGTLIQNLSSPLAADTADISGDGYQDLIIAYEYGRTLLDTDPDGGKIAWLENPGQNNGTKLWTMHYVGKSPAMHRLKVGHFTQTDRWEIVGLPVNAKPFDAVTPIPVLLFREPDNVLNATEWTREIINQDYFHIIHEATTFKVDQLDNLLLASREGITWVYFNQNSKKWTMETIGEGELGLEEQTGIYGTGVVCIGRTGNDSLSYIAAGEPFHGNMIAVYVKNTDNVLNNIQWKRYVLDVYGYPNEQGEGPIHHIICADFDKDGDDEFLIALRGPSPTEGVYLYKPIDVSRGLFLKWKVSDISAARITVADFDYDGLLDFATIGYNVPRYYVAENTSIYIFYNRFNQEKLPTNKDLQVMKQNNELLFKVSRPNKALQYQAVPFLTIGGITLSLEIIPPYSSRQVNNYTYVKVLWGNVMWTDSSTNSNQSVDYSRQFLCKPRTACSLEINSDNDRIKTGSEGALLFVHKLADDMNDIPRFSNIKNVTLENSLPEYVPQDARQLAFQFIKYDQINSADNFKGLEFYNLKGFNITFADDNEHLCYIEMWAAGLGVNAGVHNHVTDSFCEVHACIINGSGKGGVYYLNSSNEDYNSSTTLDSAFIQLIVPSFYEHGPLWDIDAENKPVLRSNGTVVYPWHKWQAGTDASVNQSFDVWSVIQFNPKLSILPSSTPSSSTSSSTLSPSTLPSSTPSPSTLPPTMLPSTTVPSRSSSLLNSYVVLLCSCFACLLFNN